MNFCLQCGAENREGAKFCATCRAPLTSVSDLKSQPLALPPSAEPTPLTEGQRAWEIKTQPLPPPPDFAPLPAGALLAEQRYAVVALIHQNARLNVYSVVDRARRYCPQCGSTANMLDEAYCKACGADLTEQEMVHPGYLLRETLDRELLEREAHIASLGLSHQGMVNLYHAFDHLPYSTQARMYLLSDADTGIPLASIPKPQPEMEVLTWGQQLAEVLAYLHSQGVCHRNIRIENICLVDGQAKLTNFGWAEKVPKSAPPEWFAEDVRSLVQTLHELLAGGAPSPVTTALFETVTTPNGVGDSAALALAFQQARTALHPPRVVTHMVGRCSDVGLQRELNEDSLLTLEIEQVEKSQVMPLGLYVVADGMGGHAAGEVASALANRLLAQIVGTKVLLQSIHEATPPEATYRNVLQEACLEANRVVYEEGRKRGSDIGTTLVAALLVGNKAFVANIGDSRAYLVNQQAIQQLTTDHSLVERLIATGQITREEGRTHPQRNVIYRTLGNKNQVEVDLIEQLMQPGDCLVLCSDGLHGLLGDSQIQQKILQALHPQEACEELVRLANEAGGHDNITVIVVKLKEVGRGL